MQSTNFVHKQPRPQLQQQPQPQLQPRPPPTPTQMQLPSQLIPHLRSPPPTQPQIQLQPQLQLQLQPQLQLEPQLQPELRQQQQQQPQPQLQPQLIPHSRSPPPTQAQLQLQPRPAPTQLQPQLQLEQQLHQQLESQPQLQPQPQQQQQPQLQQQLQSQSQPQLQLQPQPPTHLPSSMHISTSGKEQYAFPLSKETIEHLIRTSRPDPRTNHNTHFLGSGYKSFFEREMAKCEQAHVRLRFTYGVIYPNKKRYGTLFLTVTAHCLDCCQMATTHGKCKFIIKVNPLVIDASFAVVHVECDVHRHHPSQPIRRYIEPPTAVNDATQSTSSSSGFGSIENVCIKGESRPYVRQLRGDERAEVVTEIVINHQGSAANYRNHQLVKGEPSENIRSEAVYRTAVWNANNGNRKGATWQFQLTSVCDVFRAVLRGKIRGYFQSLQLLPELEVALFMDTQLDCLFRTPYASRHLYIRAHTDLVKISNKEAHYSQFYHREITNYIFTIRNPTMPSKNTFQLAEFISSCEAEPFSIFLQRLKFASKKDFNQYLNFRLVVIDFSWQIMHSVLHSLNQQTIPEYADVVYRVAQQPDLMRTEFSDHSWLTCCASNTMKRFISSLKELHLSEQIRAYATFTFSLLLDCTNLDEASDIYEQLCYVFLSTHITPRVAAAKAKLEQFLDRRPNGKAEMAQLYRRVNFEFNLETAVETANCSILVYDNSDSWAPPDDEVEFSLGQRFRLSLTSPFRTHFKDIRIAVQAFFDVPDLFNDRNDANKNALFCSAFVNYLIAAQMPYMFVWGGFVLHGTDSTLVSNDTIEASQRLTERHTPKNLLPHRYVNESYPDVKAKCDLYKRAIIDCTNGPERFHHF